MKSQKSLIEERRWDYLIITDAGRADVFSEIYEDYFDGSYEAIYNDGHTFTATWFADHFPGKYDMTLYHGGLPIHAFTVNPEDYDGRDHFSRVIGWEEFKWDNRRSTCPPDAVVDVVEEYPCQSGVIRFLQPHGPYNGLPSTSGIGGAKQHSSAELREAYTDTYRWVLEVIRDDLFDLLDGRVVITSDHGDAFGEDCCGQYLHAVEHDECECLMTVPWFETTI